MTRQTDTRHVWPRLTRPQAEALLDAATEKLAGERERNAPVLDRAVDELREAIATWEYHNR